MTYKKLSRYLTLGSLLVMLVVWGLTLFHYVDAHYAGFRSRVANGSLVIATRKYQDSPPLPAHLPTPRHVEPLWIKSQPRGYRLIEYLGRWEYKEIPSGISVRDPLTGRHHLVNWLQPHYTFPLWAPWLLFVICTSAFCKLMEKLSVSGKEKELAVSPGGDGSFQTGP